MQAPDLADILRGDGLQVHGSGRRRVVDSKRVGLDKGSAMDGVSYHTETGGAFCVTTPNDADGPQTWSLEREA